MRSGSNRLIVFGVALFICIGLIALSASGLLGPVQNLVTIPVSLAQRAISGITRQISNTVNTLANFQSLQAQNEQLEHALVSFQAEIVELREVKADYDRVVALLNYKNKSDNAGRQYVAATVIGRDTTGLLRNITVDRGTRDGLAIGMPVVTELGLVGRITTVTSLSAQVTLVIDPSSYVNSRLQKSRAEGRIVGGSVSGTASGDLRMTFIPLKETISDDEVVVTSGIGGNFPRGLTIGQVTSSRLDDSKLFQEAEVRSLIDFNRLEIVLVITNFEPLDTSAFATPVPAQ